MKLTKSQIYAFLRQNLTMAHWICLSLLCRCKWMRTLDLWYGNDSKQYLLLWRNKRVYCACTRFMCMHKILVHAQHSCAWTIVLCMHWRGQGPRPGPKKSAGPGRTPILVHAQESWTYLCNLSIIRSVLFFCFWSFGRMLRRYEKKLCIHVIQ